MANKPVKNYLSQYPKRRITRKEAELRVTIGETISNKGEESKKARAVLERIPYITIATSNKKSVPWNTPVFCAYDKDYNFYWISSRECVHSVNIEANPNVALVVYDSTVPDGEGIGVYIKARARILESRPRIRKALELLYKRKHRAVPSAGDFVGAPRGVYKATTSAFWINDLKKKAGEFRYLRMEIQLK
ncbi:MAG: pyridoxamine 5'-phosphate oxidase family protein [Candidatus Micrarchaeota archaeon]|nr:pyridoxamine 5'-phosphate oxidase family protein [Candidatus Micrarchaeota archaeon]